MSTSIRQLYLILVFSSIGVCPRALSQETPANHQELADALIKVEGNEETWFRCGPSLALCLEIGVPEERFRETHPRAKLDDLPAPVLAALRHGAGGIPAWISCFDDERETGIAKNDLFGGGSSPNAKKIKCGDAAADVVAALIPATKLPNRGRDKGATKAKLAGVGAEWETHVRDMTPQVRMKALFDGASADQRRLLLAIVIQMHHASAYPLIEANFLERVKAPDDMLYLELSAYFRHRRAAARRLCEQVVPELRKHPLHQGEHDDSEFFYAQWKLLTNYDSLQAAIDDWLAGRLETKDLGELFVRSVDAPWAYHSMGLEPGSVFRPTMEQNLKTLVAAAAREKDLQKRIELIMMADGAAGSLLSIVDHVDPVEQLPLPRRDAEEWRTTVMQLGELFKDDREVLLDNSVTSPAKEAANIVWQLWGPERQFHERSKQRKLEDWRLDAFGVSDYEPRLLRVAAAEDFLLEPERVEPQPYPSKEAEEVVGKLDDGDAVKWRTVLEPLRWDQRLYVQAEATKDRKFAYRMWPRLIDFVNWAEEKAGEPASFAAVWRDKISGRKLDTTTGRALEDWLVAEAKEGRYWTIIAESYPVWPGITLYVLPTTMHAEEANSHPTLRNRIESLGLNFEAKPETFEITSGGLHEIVLENDKIFQDWAGPLVAIEKQTAKTADDDRLCDRGFKLVMMVMPPTK